MKLEPETKTKRNYESGISGCVLVNKIFTMDSAKQNIMLNLKSTEWQFQS